MSTRSQAAALLAAGILRSRGAAAALDADAVTLIAAMSSQPDATRKALISDTITDLKAAGIWDELDEIWFFAAHTEQAALLGWKRLKDCLAVNAPTFTADQGFAGNGTTSYLNTQFIPSTHGVQYTLNDASFGVYSRTDAAASTEGIGVSSDSGGRLAHIIPRLATGGMQVRINADSTITTTTNTDSRGLFVARRTASNLFGFWRNGTELGTNAQASVGLPTLAMYIGARNNGGTPSLFSTRQHAAAPIGASMTAQQQSDLATIVEAYLDAVGAGVI